MLGSFSGIFCFLLQLFFLFSLSLSFFVHHSIQYITLAYGHRDSVVMLPCLRINVGPSSSSFVT